MSFFDSSKWKQWAQEWNFVHSPQKRLNYPNEWIAGQRDHRLVKVAWGGEKGARLFVIVRFAGTNSSASLYETLRADESLAKLPGWKKIKPMKPSATRPVGAGTPARTGTDFERQTFKMNALTQPDLVVDEHSVVWSHVFSWTKPKPAKLREFVEALLQSISRSTTGFEDRCEQCGTGRVNGFVMYETIPMLICPGCRERAAIEAKMAEQAYEQEEANVPLGLAYAALAAVIGGVLWAAIAVFTGRIFVAVALGIGAIVAFGYKLGARKLDRVGQVAGALLTVVGVLFGDIVLYAWWVKELHPEVGFNLEAGWYAFLNMLQESPGDIILSAFFGAVGAIVAVNVLRKPRFAPRIESPEEAIASKKKAA